ncbi:hypothetical protein N4G69_03045 [Streptomyces mirabilis]|uniref:hypothetical protein n=1 Tax=Streptomyces mirabilis TaxID=68239 RepID=UPI0021BFC043|nr:hypothetical protein [Streptomyces mirabilis]MCT9104615.1 hypothetical protein [Streptomyces mirabilis]
MDGKGLGSLRRSDFDAAGIAMAMHDLLGRAVEVELMMTSVISAHLGRDLEPIFRLETKAIPQLSVNSTISLLEEIMQGDGWDQDFPFITPFCERSSPCATSRPTQWLRGNSAQ